MDSESSRGPANEAQSTTNPHTRVRSGSSPALLHSRRAFLRRRRPLSKVPTQKASRAHSTPPALREMLPACHHLLLLALVSLAPLGGASATGAAEGFCSAEPSSDCSQRPPLYWKVTNPTLAPVHLRDLPGFTRSVYKKDHALITPESHVFSPLPDWTNTLGAYLISPALGAHFTMYLANMQDGSKSALPPKDVERLIFVLQGSIALSVESGTTHSLLVDSYAYLPANMKHSLISDEPTTLVIFERRYTAIEDYHPDLVVGSTDKQPLLETPGEVFELRKLLPTSLPYDFNIHGTSNNLAKCTIQLRVCYIDGMFLYNGFSARRVSQCEGGSLQSTWAAAFRGTRNISFGRQLVPGASRRYHLDGAVRASVVCCPW
ncbi:unnamed protein product [Alopecurus aequalis]